MGWIAAVLAAGACAAAGHGASGRLEKREKLLRAWGEALSRMERAVERGGAALSAVLRRGAGEGVETLNRLADILDENPAQAPEAMLDRLAWDPLLTPREKETLADCLLELFSPDRETQLRALAEARSQWMIFCQSAREIREKNSRLYVSLGWLAGAGMFILLC